MLNSLEKEIRKFVAWTDTCKVYLSTIKNIDKGIKAINELDSALIDIHTS